MAFEKFLGTLAVRTGPCMDLDTGSSRCSPSSAAAGKDSPGSASASLALRKEGAAPLSSVGKRGLWGMGDRPPILAQLGGIVLEICARHRSYSGLGGWVTRPRTDREKVLNAPTADGVLVL